MLDLIIHPVNVNMYMLNDSYIAVIQIPLDSFTNSKFNVKF